MLGHVGSMLINTVCYIYYVLHLLLFMSIGLYIFPLAMKVQFFGIKSVFFMIFKSAGFLKENIFENSFCLNISTIVFLQTSFTQTN